MKIRAIKTALATSLAVMAGSAFATDIRFDGFASFVAGQVLDKKEMTSDNFRGYDDKLGFQYNSIFALQARADLKQGLSATAQVTAKGIDDYAAKFNWAYLSYEINDEWTARVGRSRIPYFMYSDFLDVGYAYHWISPPDSVYNLAGFDSADGIAVDYQTDIGNWVSRVTFMVGRSDTELRLSLNSSAQSRISDLALISWNMNYDWFTFHAIVSRAKLTIDLSDNTDLNTLFSTVLQPQMSASDLAVAESAILVDNDDAVFSGVGFSIDKNNILLMAEYTLLDLGDNMFSNDDKRWYISGGYRYKDLTFYATYEEEDGPTNKDAANIVYNLLPGGTANPGAPYVAATYDGNVADSKTYSAGIRYNFHPSACAKLEYITQDDKQNDVKPQAIAVAIDLVY